MMQAGSLFLNHVKSLLENKKRAVLFAIIFSIMPFAAWLSAALVCLVTLRKGAKAGFEVMLPALVIHSVPLMMLVPIESALINTLFTYVPCYLAAWSLRKSTNWQFVFGVFLIQAFAGFFFVQMLAPEFVIAQFNHFKSILTHFQEYKELINNGTDGISTLVLPQLFFGIQILSVLVSALTSLMFARSLQAKLFLPGGFKEEVLKFRSGRLSFLLLIAVSVGSYFEVPIAINLLPLTLAYFLLSGFSLAYYTLARKRHVEVIVLLLLFIFLRPSFMLFAYIVFGSLDSLFNFRLYLPARMRESI